MVAETAQKKSCRVNSPFSCLSLPDYRTFIDDYSKIVEFIEWLKDVYPEKAVFLKNKLNFYIKLEIFVLSLHYKQKKL